MKSKRFLAVLCLILCVVMAFGLAACGHDEKPNNGDKVEEKVTVTFKNGDTVVDTVEIVKGTAVAATTKTITAPEGKQFKSWQKGGTDWDFATKVNENITLTATLRTFLLRNTRSPSRMPRAMYSGALRWRRTVTSTRQMSRRLPPKNIRRLSSG